MQIPMKKKVKHEQIIVLGVLSLWLRNSYPVNNGINYTYRINWLAGFLPSTVPPEVNGVSLVSVLGGKVMTSSQFRWPWMSRAG